MISISNFVNQVADSFNDKNKQQDSLSLLLLYSFQILKKKWDSHKAHDNYDDFVSTKYFPVNGVP